jgi:hypothetical protein
LAKGYPRLGEVVAGKGCAPIPLSMAEKETKLSYGAFYTIILVISCV